ncbi:MAG: hypothetical protein JWO37_1395 [Acidimicrobiales bacterium]|jgi:hypothetical protein|nr:hypothetical protein [Acidimicrobiales bacterium]
MPATTMRSLSNIHELEMVRGKLDRMAARRCDGGWQPADSAVYEALGDHERKLLGMTDAFPT